jgi:hypothetical protein
MGSIGIISLTTRRNRRFFISAEHIPVVKVRPTEVDLRRLDADIDPSPSDPLVGGLPAGGRTRSRGSMAGLVFSGRSRDLRLGFRARSGGDEETRTPDPLLAKETLCQLSYVPRPVRWWAFLDSNQRPLPYQGSALTS